MVNYAFVAIAVGCTALFSIWVSTFRSQASAFVWWMLTCLWLLFLVLYFKDAGLYSLAGIAATCGLGGLVLSFFQAVTYKQDKISNSTRPLWSSLFVLFLAVCALIPEPVHHDTFMMKYIFAVLFFLSRPLSVGCTAFAIAGLFDCLYRGNDNRVAMISKDIALLGATLFLAGEIAGTYWGFVGWGTTWRWSGNFYLSAMLFVFFMVSLHIPRTLFTTSKTYYCASVTPLSIVFLFLVLSKVIGS